MGTSISRPGTIPRRVVGDGDRTFLRAGRKRVCRCPATAEGVEPAGARPTDRLPQDDRRDAEFGRDHPGRSAGVSRPPAGMRTAADCFDPCALPAATHAVRSSSGCPARARPDGAERTCRARPRRLSPARSRRGVRQCRTHGALALLARQSRLFAAARPRNPPSHRRGAATPGANPVQDHRRGCRVRPRDLVTAPFDADRGWRNQPPRMAGRRAVEQGTDKPRGPDREGRLRSRSITVFLIVPPRKS